MPMLNRRFARVCTRVIFRGVIDGQPVFKRGISTRFSGPALCIVFRLVVNFPSRHAVLANPETLQMQDTSGVDYKFAIVALRDRA